MPEKNVPPPPRAPAREWTDEESDTLTVLHSEGLALHSIAERMDRSKSMISRHAKRLGLDFDRTATAKATEAVVIDNRARRAALETRLLAEADAELSMIREGMEVGQFAGADGEWKHAWVDTPSPTDRKAIAQTTSTLITAANKLGELNAGRDVDHAKASLSKLRASLEAEAAASE